jgi:outer membrane protein, multidrug efflux system
VSAFTNVEKALVAVEQATRQEQLQRDAVAQSRKAFDLSKEKLQGGTIDLTTLLATEQTLFTQQDTFTQVRLAWLQAIVGLFQALGAGWLKRMETRLALAESGLGNAVDRGQHAL